MTALLVYRTRGHWLGHPATIFYTLLVRNRYNVFNFAEKKTIFGESVKNVCCVVKSVYSQCLYVMTFAFKSSQETSEFCKMFFENTDVRRLASSSSVTFYLTFLLLLFYLFSYFLFFYDRKKDDSQVKKRGESTKS